MSLHDQRHISPIGMVPLEWPLRRLGSVADVSYGISKPLNRSLTTGIAILSLPNITAECELRSDDVPRIHRSLVRDCALLKHGDVLFNWRNGSSDHLGKVAFLDLKGTFAHVSFLLRIRAMAQVRS